MKNKQPTFNQGEVFDLCIEIAKKEDTKGMCDLIDIIAEEQDLYSLSQWSLISGALNRTNQMLCCA